MSSDDGVPCDNVSVEHLVEHMAGGSDIAGAREGDDLEVVAEDLVGGESVGAESSERIGLVEEVKKTGLDFAEGSHWDIKFVEYMTSLVNRLKLGRQQVMLFYDYNTERCTNCLFPTTISCSQLSKLIVLQLPP